MKKENAESVFKASDIERMKRLYSIVAGGTIFERNISNTIVEYIVAVLPNNAV